MENIDTKKVNIIHIANSALTIHHKMLLKNTNGIRLGIAMYGLNPSYELFPEINLKQALSLYSKISQVKLIESKLGKAFAGFDVEINGKLKYFPNFTAEQFEKEALVEVNSFEDLFKNRLKIKSAIARANIDTKISAAKKSRDPKKISSLIEQKKKIEAGPVRLFLSAL